MLRKIFLCFAALGFLVPANAQVNYEQIDADEIKLERQEPPRVQRLQGVVTMLRPAGLILASFDSNMDYQISPNEFTHGTGETFAKANRDGSQSLSLVELQNWRNAVLGSPDALPSNGSFDRNYDGQVTLAEFAEAMRFEYENSDRDGDGNVTFSDLIEVRDLGRRGSGGGEHGGERGHRKDRGLEPLNVD